MNSEGFITPLVQPTTWSFGVELGTPIRARTDPISQHIPMPYDFSPFDVPSNMVRATCKGGHRVVHYYQYNYGALEIATSHAGPI